MAALQEYPWPDKISELRKYRGMCIDRLDAARSLEPSGWRIRSPEGAAILPSYQAHPTQISR
jgi:hypothetical protein